MSRILLFGIFVVLSGCASTVPDPWSFFGKGRNEVATAYEPLGFRCALVHVNTGRSSPHRYHYMCERPVGPGRCEVIEFDVTDESVGISRAYLSVEASCRQS